MNMDTLKQQFLEQWHEASEQAKENTRLRVSLWIILFILVGYPVLVLNDYNESIKADIVKELEREARILRTANEREWFERSETAASVSRQIDQYFWQANSVGIAKATLFQTLNDWATAKQLQNAQIRLEEPFAVDDLNGIYRIAGQIDVAFNATSSMDFLRQIESSDKKIVVERMEISQRVRPVHKLVIAAYFKIEDQS